MKNILCIMAMAALTMVWGCSSDNNDDGGDDKGTALEGYANFTSSATPQWQVDMTDNQQRPQWAAPDQSKYENKMIVMVRLQDELTPYSTDDDLMAIFVQNECRALSLRDGNDEKVYFVLNLHGSANEEKNFTLNYYSGGLKQLFSLTGQNTFQNELNVGIESDFSPNLMYGSTKYAVKTIVTVEMPEPMPFEESDNDLIAAFVGGMCRGTGKPGQPFIVFTNSTDEQVQLRYYSQRKGGIFTDVTPIRLTGDEQTITFQF